MLGIATFAQSTFAGLNKLDYVDSIFETETLTDAETVLAQFVATQTNTQTLTDVETAVQNFPVVQNGNTQTLTDIQVGGLSVYC